MFIQTEPTPNPATMKFLPGETVLANGTANFSDAEMARRSPLAERLFLINGIDGVFLGSDFITVTKADDQDWQTMKPQVLSAVMEHFTSGEPVVVADDDGEGDGAEDGCREECGGDVSDL